MKQPGSVWSDFGRDRLGSPETLELKVCLVWRADPARQVPQDPPDHRATPSLSLLPLSRAVRPSLECPGPRDPWELPALPENEEPTVRGGRGEGEESRACLAHLELPAGRDCQAGLETLESLASQAGR